MPEPTAPPRRTAASVSLDAARAMAALLVLLGHWRNLFFVDYREGGGHGALLQGFYAVTGLGHEAVMVFFVLSGYLIGASVLRSRREGHWSWGRYARQRLTRLYVVLIPALLLGAALDLAGTHRFGASSVYGAPAQYAAMVSSPVLTRLTARAWFGNLLFLQTIAVPTFGSNGALWSLANEFWYYVLFPLLVLVGARGALWWNRLAGAGLCVAICVGVGREIVIYFAVWLLGAALCLPTPPADSRRLRLLSGLLALGFAGALLIARFSALHRPMLEDFLVATAFAGWLWTRLATGAPPPAPWLCRGSQYVAEMSFSLYLIHLPLLMWMNAWLIGGGRRWPLDARHLAVGLLAPGAILAVTRLFWRVTEAHTDRVRRWTDARFAERV